MIPTEAPKNRNAAGGAPPVAQGFRTRESRKEERQDPIRGALHMFTSPAKVLSEPFERRYRERYEGRHRFARHLFVFDLALLCIVFLLAAASAALVLHPPRYVPPLSVSLHTEAALPKNGETVTLSFLVKNDSGGELDNVTLALDLGLFRVSVAPENFDLASNTFSLGEFPGGGERLLSLNAVALFGPPSEPGEGKLVATVRGEREGKLYEYRDAHEMSYEGSVIALAYDGPETLAVGESRDVTFVLSNHGPAPLGPISLDLCPGGALVLLHAPSGCAYETIPLLAPREYASSTFLVEAKSVEGLSILVAHVNMTVERGVVTFLEQEFSVGVLDPEKRVELRLGPPNEASLPLVLLSPAGEEATIETARILRLRSSGEETALAEAGSPDIRSLADRGEWRVEVAWPSDRDTDALRLIGEVTLRRSEAGEPVVLRSPLLVVPFPPEVGLEAAARYFSPEGEQLGRGPLPPEVGKKTEYWIFWNVTPLSRDIRSLGIAAALPPGVSWVGKQSVGISGASPVVYDAAGGRVVWNQENISSKAAERGIVVAFSVSVTPEAADRGKILPLLQKTTLAIETADGTSAGAEFPALTTALTGYSAAEGNGRVE